MVLPCLRGGLVDLEYCVEWEQTDHGKWTGPHPTCVAINDRIEMGSLPHFAIHSETRESMLCGLDITCPTEQYNENDVSWGFRRVARMGISTLSSFSS